MKTTGSIGIPKFGLLDFMGHPTVHISHTCSTFVQSGERLSDGAFSPRDHKHGSGEEHNNAFDHEAILGSRKDAEEYDDLSPEEAKKRLRVSGSKQV